MAQDISNETVTLENLIERYHMSLFEISEKCDADKDFITEATRYLLEVPEELTHQSERDEYVAERLNKYVKAGLDINTVVESVQGVSLSDALSKRGMTVRKLAENLGIADDEAVETFITDATRDLLMKPKDDKTKDVQKYAYDTFCTHALRELDLNVAAEMTGMRKSELVELSGLNRKMFDRDLKSVEKGVHRGLQFSEICRYAGFSEKSSLSDIAQAQGYSKDFVTKASELILCTRDGEDDTPPEKLAARRFAGYASAGLDLDTLFRETKAVSFEQKMQLIEPRLKQIVESTKKTLPDLAKELQVPLRERNAFYHRATRALVHTSRLEIRKNGNDEEAATRENLFKFAFAGLNVDEAARATGFTAEEIKKDYLRPAKLHKKTLVNFAHMALTEASYGDIGTKAAHFFARRSAKFKTAAKQADAADKNAKKAIYTAAEKVSKKLGLAGKGFSFIETQLKRPGQFIDKKIDAQIMKVGERHETLGRVLSTAKSVVYNSAEAAVVGVAAMAIAPTVSVSAGAALTACWGVTYLRSAKKGLFDFYSKAAASCSKDSTKTPAQNRASVRKSVGKYVGDHQSDLRKAWIKAGMNTAYGLVGGAAIIKIAGGRAALNTAVGYKSIKDTIKYTRRGINGAYMVKNDLKDVQELHGKRRMKFAAEKIISSVALAAAGENVGRLGICNVNVGNGFKSGDFIFVPIMDSTNISSHNEVYRHALKELRSADGRITTGLTLDQIGRAHGYDHVQTSQFTREMTKELFAKAKTPKEKEAVFKKHAMDGLDLFEAFHAMGIDKPTDVLERRRLVQTNITDLAAAGISLSEMGEAVGLKAAGRREFVRQMTARLIEPSTNAKDKKQCLFDAVHAYGNLGLDKAVMSDVAAKIDVSALDVMDACRQAKEFYRKKRKEEVEEGRKVVEAGKKRDKQTKIKTVEKISDMYKEEKTSQNFFARLRQKSKSRG